VLHRLLRSAGLIGWLPNYPVRLGGQSVVLDVAFPTTRLAIEVDGLVWHVDPARFQRDRTRQNELVTAGWTVLRFTWADLTERPDHVVAVVRSTLDRLSAA